MTSASAPEPSPSEALLWQYILVELRAVPLAFWGFFFPCLLAAWRFVENRAPGRLGTLDMSYTTTRTEPPSRLRVIGHDYVLTRLFGQASEPSAGPLMFGHGSGFQWFSDTVMNAGPALDAIEAIMYHVADHLSPEQRSSDTLGDSPLERPPTHLLRSLAEALTAFPPSGAA